jgi:hypothetical protein
VSSRQFEDRSEGDQTDAVAAALGISPGQLGELEWTLEAVERGDGVLEGYNVHFSESSDPAILAAIPGLVDGRWVRIGPNL